MKKIRKPDAPSGTPHYVSARYLNRHPGPWVEPGTRFVYIRGNEVVPPGTWGTVLQRRGLGCFRARLDDGREMNPNIRDVRLVKEAS